MSVTYKGYVIGGTGNPVPAVNIEVKSNFDEVKGRVLSKTITWTITGVLLAKSGSTISQQVATLKSLFEKPIGNESFVMDVSGLTLNGSQAISGLLIDPPSFPDGSGIQWGTKLNYSIRATGTFWEDPSISEWADYSISYSTDEKGIESKSISGTYNNPTSSNIKASCESYILSAWAKNENYIRTQSIQLNGSNDGNKKTCTFTIADRGLFKALPLGVSSASVQKTIERGTGGEGFLNISASFTGMNRSLIAAKTAAELALQPYSGMKMVSYSESEDEYAGVFNINVKYLNNITSTISEDETISITPSMQDFTIKPVLGGRPIKQNTVIRPATANQSGSKVSIFSNVSPNNPRWAGDLKKSTVTYSTPTYGVGFTTLLYKVSWNYEFESIDRFNFNGY